ncbi:hydrogen gas-evolving membrane-bound hydrogenase subunit E [Roseococcus thiosulfatophilus]|uniref:hydrogen gas-evolving membrane-bound hydrogenase subunit E n=1 Tax=Roseococcus thiosulfatophilus TaxID=35813 RepID=UPI001A8CDF6F|nr:hydrogen gas-evolving membrane-bound hydrogenase subunit E [Roseococcus thiosulfatophilus]
MIGTALDLVVVALLVAAALAAVGARGLFAGVVFFVGYGVFVAIAWLRLDAIDVALAEAAIGAGLTGVLLLGAVGHLTRAGAGAPPRRPAIPLALACAGISVMLGWAVLSLPDAPGLQAPVAAALPGSGSTNPVTSVLLNFRAFDTLLESIVLLAVLVGVWALAPDAAWGGRPGLVQRVRPDGVLAGFGRLLPPLGLLVGVYLVWAGTKQPGGAFQGGTVLAAVWLLASMAGVARAPRVTSLILRAALVAGPVLFLAVGMAGALGGSFLGLRPDWAAALVLTIEVGLTLSIASALALLVLGPPERPA